MGAQGPDLDRVPIFRRRPWQRNRGWRPRPDTVVTSSSSVFRRAAGTRCGQSSDTTRGPSLSMHGIPLAVCAATILGECRALLAHCGRRTQKRHRWSPNVRGGSPTPRVERRNSGEIPADRAPARRCTLFVWSTSCRDSLGLTPPATCGRSEPELGRSEPMSCVCRQAFNPSVASCLARPTRALRQRRTPSRLSRNDRPCRSPPRRPLTTTSRTRTSSASSSTEPTWQRRQRARRATTRTSLRTLAFPAEVDRDRQIGHDRPNLAKPDLRRTRPEWAKLARIRAVLSPQKCLSDPGGLRSLALPDNIIQNAKRQKF